MRQLAAAFPRPACLPCRPWQGKRWTSPLPYAGRCRIEPVISPCLMGAMYSREQARGKKRRQPAGLKVSPAAATQILPGWVGVYSNRWETKESIEDSGRQEPAAFRGARRWVTFAAKEWLPSMKIAIGFQIAALVVAGLAVVWGGFCAFTPGPGGEWAGVGVLAAWLVNVPTGILTLAIALIVRKGSPRLRRLCIVTSLVALTIPVMASLIWHHLH